MTEKQPERLTAGYMRAIVERAKAHYDANDGYQKGVERMAQIARAEEEMHQRDIMLQVLRELPERERVLIVGNDTLPGIARKPGQWHAPATWLMGARSGARWQAGCTALLHGPAGEGKSTAACLLGYHEALSGRSVRYECTYAPEWLRSTRARDDQDCDVLILDESRRALEQGAWIQGAVKELINYRHEWLRNTVLVFTGELGQFVAGFGPEVLDRVPPELRYPPPMQQQTALSSRWKEGTP